MEKQIMSKEKNVDANVRRLAPGKQALVQRLRRMVKAQAPDLVEVMNWGNTVRGSADRRSERRRLTTARLTGGT